MTHDALLRQLEEFHPDTADEAASLAEMREHLHKPGDPFDRHRYDGHLTGSAWILSDTEPPSFLLIFHRKLRRWLQPGGHALPSEADALTIARREAQEETGLTDLTLIEGIPQPFDLDVHAIPESPREPAHRHLDIRFAFRASRTATVRPQLDEVDGIRWFDEADLDALETDESVRRAVRKLLRLRGSGAT